MQKCKEAEFSGTNILLVTVQGAAEFPEDEETEHESQRRCAEDAAATLARPTGQERKRLSSLGRLKTKTVDQRETV